MEGDGIPGLEEVRKMYSVILQGTMHLQCTFQLGWKQRRATGGSL